MSRLLNQVLKTSILTFVVLFPSFLLTNFASYFDLPKVLLLVFALFLILAVWSVKIITEGKITLNVSSSDMPLLLLVVAYIASAITKTPNKMEAFAIPGTATIIAGGFLAYFFAKIAFKGDRENFALGLFLSSLLVALISIFAFTGLLASIPQLPAVIRDANFSAVGGKLPEVMFLVSVLPLGISAAFSEKDKFRKIFFFLASGVVLLSSLLSVYQMLPGKPGTPVVVDTQTSWSVAIDTLKASPLLGAGPANYLSAFTKYLPLSYNSTDLWANRFFSASSFVLTLVTEVGFLGLAAFVFAIFTMIKGVVKNLRNLTSGNLKLEAGYSLSLVLMVVGLLTLPANIVVIVAFFLIAALNTKDNELTMNLSATSVKDGGEFASKLPAIVVSVVILGFSVYPMVVGVKVIKGELHYKKAIDAILANNAKTAYDELRAAIASNDKVDRYHATFDQLDLALARGLASKKDITDQDKSTIAQLVQQAIAEAKATVALNPQRSANWELLARTYQSIIPFAQGADNFTIVSFNQAIALDPISPNLRIALGGVYYALGKYDDAINAFGLAVTAKPDLANAHYNLALAYNQKKDFDKALTEMNKVLSLVQPGSEDEKIAKAAVEQIQKNKPAAKTAEGSDNLTPPPTVAPSAVKPPIVLPEDSNPPATP